MADFGTIGYATLEPGSSLNEEQISFTTITQNAGGTATLTGVSSVGFTYPYASTTGFAKSHAAGVQFVISNTAGFYNQFATKDDDQTLTGQNTFTQLPTSTVVPTTSSQLANKAYVDGVIANGVPNATTSVLGGAKLTSPSSTSLGAATISAANPAVVTYTIGSVLPGQLIAGDTIQFTTTGTLPTPIVANTTYYVISTGLASTHFEISTSSGGSAISTNGASQSGTHTLLRVTPFAVGADSTSIAPVGVSLATLTANEVAALAGTGTPNSTNKYVTSDTAAGYQTTANLDTTTTLGTSDTKYPSQKAVKTYVDNSLLTVPPTTQTADSNLSWSDDATVNFTNNSPYTKKKEILLNENLGAVNVKFDINSGSGNTAYGKLYKNGVAVGTEITASSGTTTSTTALTNLVVGDLLQVYCYALNGGTNGGGNVSNFRLYFTKKLTQVSNIILTTPLTVNPFITNPTNNS
jgi:hypothetical protein